jgi:hypothetical protein
MPFCLSSFLARISNFCLGLTLDLDPPAYDSYIARSQACATTSDFLVYMGRYGVSR